MGDRKFNTNDQQIRAEAFAQANMNAAQQTPTELIVAEAEKIVDYVTNGLVEGTPQHEVVSQIMALGRLKREQNTREEALRQARRAKELSTEYAAEIAEYEANEDGIVEITADQLEELRQEAISLGGDGDISALPENVVVVDETVTETVEVEIFDEDDVPLSAEERDVRDMEAIHEDAGATNLPEKEWEGEVLAEEGSTPISEVEPEPEVPDEGVKTDGNASTGGYIDTTADTPNDVVTSGVASAAYGDGQDDLLSPEALAQLGGEGD